VTLLKISKKTLFAGTAIAIGLATPIAALVALNAALSLVFDVPLSNDDWDRLRREKAAASNVPFDQRTWRDLWRECGFQQCQPEINPLEKGFPSDGTILPVALGPRHSRVINCNETGVWEYNDLDIYGFNGNSDEQYAVRQEIVLIGDSFTQGGCVKPGESIAGRLREESGAVLNLGVDGQQPLGELAVLKEYLPPSDVLVWLFFEGNDYALKEKNHLFLRQYLAPGFTQRLAQRSDEIDVLFDRAIQALRNEDTFLIMSWLDGTKNMFRPTREMIYFVKGQLRERLFGLFFNFDRDLFSQILAEAKRFAMEERHTQVFMFAYLPTYERFARQSDPSYHKVEHFKKLRDAVKEIAVAQGWRFVDVAGAFEQHPDPLALFPFRLDAHYNADGYAVAYEAIHQALPNR